MDKISVIVPVYNVESYIERCLESIIHQTYNKLQIILVDDGSTDRSLQICQQYASQDSRIRIVKQKNAGSSAARNMGISLASGKYLTFIDSDDWLSDNLAISKMYNALKTYGLKICIGSFDGFDEYINSYRLFHHDSRNRIYKIKDWFSFEYTGTRTISFVTPWGKLFSTELFKHVRFPIVKVGEDDLTLWRIYLQTHQLIFIDKPVYIYRMNRRNSIMNCNNILLPSLSAVEQRIAVMKASKLSAVNELNGYNIRLNVDHNNALSAPHLSLYKNSTIKRRIIKNYL